MLNDLGFPDALVKVTDPMEQRQVWEVRKAGLNIMMSMKGEGKPVSFIEDCAVPLEHLADYTDRLTEIFHRHGTTGTWYAHASEGCLHVRPILNMKETSDVKKMRSIAEEAFAMVREYKGSHSGEHGDGIVQTPGPTSQTDCCLLRANESATAEESAPTQRLQSKFEVIKSEGDLHWPLTADFTFEKDGANHAYSNGMVDAFLLCACVDEESYYAQINAEGWRESSGLDRCVRMFLAPPWRLA